MTVGGHCSVIATPKEAQANFGAAVLAAQLEDARDENGAGKSAFGEGGACEFECVDS